MMQRKVPTIQKAQSTVEVFQSLVVDNVDVPVVVLQKQAPMVQETADVPQDCETRRSHEAA